MSVLSKVLRDSPGNGLSFWCPGCDGPHRIQHGAGDGPRWGWNGDVERPTFTPSVLTWWDEPAAAGNPDELRAQVARKRADPSYQIPYVKKTCHSFVTDGRIQFLGDCTHALAGQTVPLAEFPEGWGC
ncbi:DUF6527 family protein [Cupriavidus sp. CV2]|uniref:DUF6527 family protein n=1 Tax=Cupriavidus ulmosensis TaxID=3065913 RepID=UPI00296B30EC|nr:DUF6527 family protein [Cupriavidus sp. CV2]MDW3682639.1 DUF6527 family protein [Cupriavidus sp. CV2]